MSFDRRVVASFALALLLISLVVAACFWAFAQIESASTARTLTDDLIARANAVLSGLKDGETSQRGFLLTGDEDYLQPYLAAHAEVGGQLKDLHRLASASAGRGHLDALIPLVDAKLAQMAQVIALRRGPDPAAAQTAAMGEGKRLMDSIRAGMDSFIRLEESVLVRREADLQANMRRMFVIIITASLLMFLFALTFAYLIYRETRQRLKGLVHLETRRLLEVQEKTNEQLQHTNVALLASEENLAVTLNSIGDAVIATDAAGQVTRLNPLAEQLTGWAWAEAAGRPVGEIFNVINQETRRPATVPVMETLALGIIQGMANHTILIARNGGERAIADSCAPIRDREGQVVGAVLVFRDVTAEYALRRTADERDRFFALSRDMLCICGFDGYFKDLNPAWETTLGYTKAELLAMPYRDLIHPDDLQGTMKFADRVHADDTLLEFENRYRAKDGAYHWLLWSATPIDGYRLLYAVARDITEQKRLHAALVRASALQNAIFSSASFSAIATDVKGVIQIFNVGAERMLGYAAADVLDRITPADLSDPREIIARAALLSIELATPIAPGFEALVFKASRGIEDIYELTYIRKDGSRLPALVSVTALRDAQGAIIGYLLIGTDNTARLRVETERNAALAAAEKANLAKSEFLSSMSHELRTPLNAILGFAQLMETGEPPPTAAQKKSLDQILQAGWYLLELINEILDLALIESGKATMSHEPVALAEVMRECRAMIEPQAHKRGIGMSFPHFDGRTYISADRTRVKQVLLNLLFNAIKYNRTGGTVTVECTPAAPAAIRISIRDTGTGLAPAQVAQLFQPFNRLGKEAGAEQGTGIGLVVTKRLVELMGGRIGVDSVPGTGSVFWVEMGLTKAPQLLAWETAHPVPAAPAPAAGTPPRTLLYVEDNPANLELVEQLIARRPDLRLLGAADGSLGIEYARAYQPAVILMDINLPGISGIEAMQILRADPATAQIPIIALSANAVPRDIEKALAAGFFDYVTKPIKVIPFMESLDRAVAFAQSTADRNTLKEPT